MLELADGGGGHGDALPAATGPVEHGPDQAEAGTFAGAQAAVRLRSVLFGNVLPQQSAQPVSDRLIPLERGALVAKRHGWRRMSETAHQIPYGGAGRGQPRGTAASQVVKVEPHGATVDQGWVQ